MGTRAIVKNCVITLLSYCILGMIRVVASAFGVGCGFEQIALLSGLYVQALSGNDTSVESLAMLQVKLVSEAEPFNASLFPATTSGERARLRMQQQLESKIRAILVLQQRGQSVALAQLTRGTVVSNETSIT